jgi:hypothetical protein
MSQKLNNITTSHESATNEGYIIINNIFRVQLQSFFFFWTLSIFLWGGTL